MNLTGLGSNAGFCNSGNELLAFIITVALSGKTLPQHALHNLVDTDYLFFISYLKKIEHFITTVARTSNPIPFGLVPTVPPF
jgi:hypothetical protein